jgi:hypothetical protein
MELLLTIQKLIIIFMILNLLIHVNFFEESKDKKRIGPVDKIFYKKWIEVAFVKKIRSEQDRLLTLKK